MSNPKPYVRVRLSREFLEVVNIVTRTGVATVCEESLCPNIVECWSKKSATFMVLGNICTRNCRFCAVKKGIPKPPNPKEPELVARAVKDLGLKYVAITSVSRDDLADGGASHIANVIASIKEYNPDTIVEVLIPDFRGDERAIEKVVNAGPDVISHNIEVVRRLTPLIRDRRASYEQSLKVLDIVKRLNPRIVTKSSLILGLGETLQEVIEAMKDLRAVNCDILVLSQYYRPTPKQVPVSKVVPMGEFKLLENIAYKLGFKAVVAHPLARTTYRALWAYNQVMRMRIHGIS